MCGRYVYDDAAHEMPYVDEYTHLDDEHYFAMEADHDAETAIIYNNKKNQ